MTAAAPSNQQRSLARRSRRRLIRRPILGVYLNRPSLDIDPRALDDCLNVRIRDGKIRNEGLGWENFPQFASDANRINLDDKQVTLIDEYRSRAGSTTVIMANKTDVFKFNPGAGPPATVTYMTPRYAAGSAEVIAGPTTTVTGTGTLWKTAKVTAPVTLGYGDNVRPGDFISFGDAAEVELTATWHEIASITDDTHLELVASTATVADGDYTIRQTFTGTVDDLWLTATFENAQDASPVGSDVYYVTNGKEMMSWNGVATEFSFFFPGFIGRGIIKTKGVLAFWNLLEAGQEKPGQVAYSEISKPNNFSTNGAGRIEPTDGVRDLKIIKPIGDQFACYFHGDIVMMQFVDAPLFFIARVAVPGVGVIAPRAMMDFGDFHEFLSTDAAYRFDGVTIEESMSQVFRSVLRGVAPNRVKRAYAYIDEENAEVIWSVPLTTDGQGAEQPPKKAFVEHYIEDVGPNLPTPMTIREFEFTAIGTFEASSSLKFEDFPATAFNATALTWGSRELSASFPFQIAGDDNGDIYILNTVNTRNGVGFDSFVTFPRVALADGNFKGLVERIEPFAGTRGGASGYKLIVFLNVFDTPDGDRKDAHLLNFDITQAGLRYVPVRKSGRYGSIAFGTFKILQAEASTPWDLEGYAITVSPVGER